MRAFTPLKKILTWTAMSIMVITTEGNIPLALAQEQAMLVKREQVIQQQRAIAFKEEIRKLKSRHRQEKLLSRQLSCLARNVYYEANGEPMKGQLAVAQVTVNRANSGKFPRDLCAVVAQSTRVSEDTRVCQFSWYCDPSKNKQRVINKNHPSYIAARRVLLDGHRVENVGRDVYFFRRHDVQMNPGWPNQTVAKIGNHIFYKRQK